MTIMASVYMKLEASMRRIIRMRELSAADDVIDTEIELAKSLWAETPASPGGSSTSWDPDIHPLAVELGFDPDTRPRKPTQSFIARIDARIDERFQAYADEAVEAAASQSFPALARDPRQLAQQIDREIRSAVSGISDLRVAAAGTTVVLAGSAADDAARRRAETIASGMVPSATIDNFIVVKR
jgi:hypothetical protein